MTPGISSHPRILPQFADDMTVQRTHAVEEFGAGQAAVGTDIRFVGSQMRPHGTEVIDIAIERTLRLGHSQAPQYLECQIHVPSLWGKGL